jgi:hypothetical protein
MSDLLAEAEYIINHADEFLCSDEEVEEGLYSLAA